MYAMVVESLLLCAIWLVPSQAPQDQAKSKTESKSTASGATSGAASQKQTDKAKELTLDEFLVQSLKHNPDIRVAEAKLMEAEAELNRSRLSTIQKAINLWNVRQNAKNALEEAEVRLGTLKKMRSQNAAAEEEVRGLQSVVQR